MSLLCSLSSRKTAVSGGKVIYYIEALIVRHYRGDAAPAIYTRICLWVAVVLVELERVGLERRLRDHRLLDRTTLRTQRHTLTRR